MPVIPQTGRADGGLRPWTADEVGRRLIEAFRKLPDTPIYSPRANVLQTALLQERPEELDLIALSTHYLGRDSRERLHLLTWARAKATGASVREICRERGWPRETFNRRRKAACRLMAAALNRDSIPAPNLASRDRLRLLQDSAIQPEACTKQVATKPSC